MYAAIVSAGITSFLATASDLPNLAVAGLSAAVAALAVYITPAD